MPTDLEIQEERLRRLDAEAAQLDNQLGQLGPIEDPPEYNIEGLTDQQKQERLDKLDSEDTALKTRLDRLKRGDGQYEPPPPSDPNSITGQPSFAELAVADEDSRNLAKHLSFGITEVKDESHDDFPWTERLFVKNMLWHDPKNALNYLKKNSELKDFEFAVHDDDIVMKKVGEQAWSKLDPGGMMDWGYDVADVGWDMAADVISQVASGMAGAGTFVATGGPTTVGGNIPLSMAAAGATGAAVSGGLEALKQKLANEMTGAEYNPMDIAMNTAVGGLSGPLFGFSPGVKSMTKMGISAADQKSLQGASALGKSMQLGGQALAGTRAHMSGVPAKAWEALEPRIKWVNKLQKQAPPIPGEVKDAAEAMKARLKADPTMQDPDLAVDYATFMTDIGKRYGPANQIIDSVRTEMKAADSYITQIGKEVDAGINDAVSRHMVQTGQPLTVETGQVARELITEMGEKLAEMPDLTGAASKDFRDAYVDALEALKGAGVDRKKFEEFYQNASASDLMQLGADPTSMPFGIAESMDLKTAHKLTQRFADAAGFYKQGAGATGFQDKSMALAAKDQIRISTAAWEKLNNRVNSKLLPEGELARKQYHVTKTARDAVGDLLRNNKTGFTTMRNMMEGSNTVVLEAMQDLDKLVGTNLVNGPMTDALVYKYFIEPGINPLSSAGATSTSRTISSSLFYGSLGGTIGKGVDTLAGTEGVFDKLFAGGAASAGNFFGSPATQKYLMEKTAPFKKAARAANQLPPGTTSARLGGRQGLRNEYGDELGQGVEGLRSGVQDVWNKLQGANYGRDPRGRRSPK